MNYSMDIAIWGARALLVGITLFTAVGASALPRQAEEALDEAVNVGVEASALWTSMVNIVAPTDARRVTVFLSFGTVKQLHFDAARGLWRGRFPVPEGVSDGHYEVLVTIEHRDGRLEQRRESYNLDGSATDFGLHVANKKLMPGDAVTVELDGVEPSSAAFLTAPSLGLNRVTLSDVGGGIDWKGQLSVPATANFGKHRVRVEVRDRMGNAYTRWFTLHVRAGGEA